MAELNDLELTRSITASITTTGHSPTSQGRTDRLHERDKVERRAHLLERIGRGVLCDVNITTDTRLCVTGIL